MKVFLDANILFSAALGGASFDLLWELGARGRVTLATSAHCVGEARRNLERKRPGALGAFIGRVAAVEPVADVEHASERASNLLPPDDALVFDAACLSGCDVLVTGDVRHFGELMSRDDLGIRVRTVRDFLLQGPPAGSARRSD